MAAEAKLKEYLEQSGANADVVQMRAVEAPIKLLRGLTRWQVFLKMYFKGDLDGAAKLMQQLADEAPAGIQAELEINPTNMF